MSYNANRVHYSKYNVYRYALIIFVVRIPNPIRASFPVEWGGKGAGASMLPIVLHGSAEVPGKKLYLLHERVKSLTARLCTFFWQSLKRGVSHERGTGTQLKTIVVKKYCRK